MGELYEIIKSDICNHFVFGTPKELCDCLAAGDKYSVIENYYDASENATKVTIDIPAQKKEISVYVQKTSRNCAEDFCII